MSVIDKIRVLRKTDLHKNGYIIQNRDIAYNQAIDNVLAILEANPPAGGVMWIGVDKGVRETSIDERGNVTVREVSHKPALSEADAVELGKVREVLEQALNNITTLHRCSDSNYTVYTDCASFSQKDLERMTIIKINQALEALATISKIVGDEQTVSSSRDHFADAGNMVEPETSQPVISESGAVSDTRDLVKIDAGSAIEEAIDHLIATGVIGSAG